MDKNEISRMLDALDTYPLHMPGHKRNPAYTDPSFPYDRDITEIAGSDNLHDPHGVILTECQRAARVWGAADARILVGGSTCGLLASIRAYGGHDRHVVVARNSHKSVYNGIELCRLTPVYLQPGMDQESGICSGITPGQVEAALCAAPDTKLVIITSPTYEGVISDVAGIASVAHAHGARLLVDAAHGAHLGLGGFAAHPVTQGADVVICSLHKTLPAPTQTALALIGHGCPDPRALFEQLAVFQTSSPSYILMEQAARCIYLMEQKGNAMADAWLEELAAFEREVKDLQHLRLLLRHTLPRGAFAYDPGKLVIGTRGTSISGHELAERLRHDYHLEIEMAASDYIIAMTSPADTKEGLARFSCALCEIDRELSCGDTAPTAQIPLPRAALAPWQVRDLPTQSLPLKNAEGCIAAEYVWAYPPGIPIVVPGERIDRELLCLLEQMQRSGTELHSTRGGMPLVLLGVKEAEK